MSVTSYQTLYAYQKKFHAYAKATPPNMASRRGGGGAPLDETLGGIVIINVQCVDPYQGDMDDVKLCDGSVLDFLNNCCWVLCFRKPFQELE